MTYVYECSKCKLIVNVIKPLKLCSRVEQCPKCFSDMARHFGKENVTFIGSTDSFSKFNKYKPFYDNGKEITTVKEWEKAGFVAGTDHISNPDVKKKVERKIDKINNHDSGKRITVGG